MGAPSGLNFLEKLLLGSSDSLLRRPRPVLRTEPAPETSDQLRRRPDQLWCSCSGTKASSLWFSWAWTTWTNMGKNTEKTMKHLQVWHVASPVYTMQSEKYH